MRWRESLLRLLALVSASIGMHTRGFLVRELVGVSEPEGLDWSLIRPR